MLGWLVGCRSGGSGIPVLLLLLLSVVLNLGGGRKLLLVEGFLPCQADQTPYSAVYGANQVWEAGREGRAVGWQIALSQWLGMLVFFFNFLWTQRPKGKRQKRRSAT